MTRTAADLSDREVAEALRKSVRTVQRWCAAGKLPGAYKSGRSWRIPRASLDVAHREAVARFEHGAMGELGESLRVASERLKRAGENIAAADLREVERLLKLFEALGASVTDAGKLAAERRRKLTHNDQLKRRLRPVL